MSELRLGLAAMLIVALAILTGIPMFQTIPETSQRVIDTSVGGLIAGLTLALQGIFRTDKTDETRAENTSLALNTIGAAIAASPAADTPQPVTIEQPEDSPVPVKEKP